MNNNPTFSGHGKLKNQFQTRSPVGKNYGGIPRLGQKLNVPVFGNRPTPIQQMKALTPAFRGPARLPSNFLKNIPGLGSRESHSARAGAFNGPLRFPTNTVKRLFKRGVSLESLQGRKKSVSKSKKVKRKTKK